MLKLRIVKPIDNTWTVKKIAKEQPPLGWLELFEDAKNELNDISEILETDKSVFGEFYPNSKDIFKAYSLTPLKKVKVVIFDYEPYASSYEGKPLAQGLSFSVDKSIKIPSTVANMYRELKQSYPKEFIIPNHGDLTKWAKNGVLLLNMCLTIRPCQKNSHKELWYGFIKKTINTLLKTNPTCVFLLWNDKKTQTIRKMLGERATVIEPPYPVGWKARDFFGSNCFKEINKILVENEKVPIDWNL